MAHVRIGAGSGCIARLWRDYVGTFIQKFIFLKMYTYLEVLSMF